MAYLIPMDISPHPTKRIAPPPLELRKHAVFVDFDGTLVDIAPRPDAIVVPSGLARRLNQLRARMDDAFAVVSGRSLHELETFLTGFNGLMIGSHGAEARGIEPPLAHAIPGLPFVQSELAAFAASRGLLYEHKPHGGAIHYRHAPESAETVSVFVHHLLERSPGFEVQPAKMAYELRPAGVSKDKALARLWQEAQFADRIPAYLGDDSTDEPALLWAQENGGFGIKIGEGESAACHRLAQPADVHAWLAAAVEG
ncbi:trehalose-phosphatase [Pseudothioclava nitratireducens]|uniref:trehalose-phosphatase n=1 Tax=Pseudothioclava nitratireducens TaxID=1928646 RepID=UPI0023DB77DB|nr:trehalose-phosphatase [Defluviimonas nitratireducens]MDF1620437.1 trehalose-phosphatase [Defluviimonas nitratireducens]